MNLTYIKKLITDFKFQKKFLNLLILFVFSVVFTGVLVSKYFFVQTIVDSDGKSKITVLAQNDMEVTDTIKTEKKKREISQKVEPVYSPADDTYIRNNLNEIINYIKKVKASDMPDKEKKRIIGTLIDISDANSKAFAVEFFLNASEDSLNSIFTASEKTLNEILEEGITEREYETSVLAKNIRNKTAPYMTRNRIKVVTALLEQVIVPNMILDEEATESARKNARDAVSPVKVKFKKGDVIIGAGEPVTPVKKEALAQAGYNILKINYLGILSIFCLVCIGLSTSIIYIKLFEPKLYDNRHLAISAFLALILAAVAVSLPPGFSVFLLPFPLFAILISIFLNPRSAFFLTVVLITIITLSLQFSALDMSVFLISVAVCAIEMTSISYSRRFDIIKTGLSAALIMALVITCVYYDLGMEKLLEDILAGILNCFISGVFALGLIPIFENVFRIITMFGLAEWGDYNQPLLKKLHEVAPGTFEHSLRVSNLAESAAEAIGANPVLTRVGALYHDVGKIVRPLFFVENQTYSGIENPHEKLTPRSSKMIITSHTKDGLAKAKEYRLPEILWDFITQHHGDSLASYFYNKAVAEEGAENVEEESFRYTGPRPNSKETAVLMIADAVESASRTLKDQSQEEIDKLIHKIITDRLNDNQLSESPLTLKDINTIAATMSRVLRSVYHKRIVYNETAENELKISQPGKA